MGSLLLAVLSAGVGAADAGGWWWWSPPSSLVKCTGMGYLAGTSPGHDLSACVHSTVPECHGGLPKPTAPCVPWGHAKNASD